MLLVVSGKTFGRICGFLDGEGLKSLHSTCNVFRNIIDEFVRVSSGKYSVVDADAFLQSGERDCVWHPMALVFERYNDPLPFASVDEFECLLQLCFVNGKMTCWKQGLPPDCIGSVEVEYRVKCMLPPGFANLVRIISEKAIHSRAYSPEKAESVLGCEHNYGDLDIDDDTMSDDDVSAGIIRKRALLLGGHDVSRPFYNNKQDLLNSIVNHVNDQYQFCSNVLRFSNDSYGGQFASDVANICGHELLTPVHVRNLYKHGFCIIDNFISPELAADVHFKCIQCVNQTAEVLSLPPEILEQIGQPPPFLMSQGEPTSARGDCLTWINKDQEPGCDPPLCYVLDRFSKLVIEVGAVVKLQGGRESQMAFYPDGGQGYHRHRDSTPDDGSEINDNRKVTCICYCNPYWKEEHGGKLRLWLSDVSKKQVVDLRPLPGRVLVFLSGLLDHEVLPSYHARVAITTWLW
mmetsp:Transcript_42907/g.68925  ORF Transcript_42907/g.68925 Transcript_42907/m.68925 type:complete len:462 (-) Transcript_42907:16-1401(-)